MTEAWDARALAVQGVLADVRTQVQVAALPTAVRSTLLGTLDEARGAWGHPTRLETTVRALARMAGTLPPPLNVTLTATCEMLREWTQPPLE